jgi:hypothetical protein
MSRTHALSVVVAIAFLTAISGCTTGRIDRVGGDTRAAIGVAATAQHPGNAQPATQQVLTAAVDHRNIRQLEILNLSDNAVANPTLWVNGTYVREIPTLAPRGTHTVRYDGLLQAGQPENDFREANQSVTRVEIQTNGNLHNVLGPVRK